MKIVIGAMEEELNQFVIDLEAQRVEGSLIPEFYQPDLDLTIAWTGVGISNASWGLTYLLTKYQDQKIEWIINAGTACGVNLTLNQNDVVLVNHAYYATADATSFGYDYGQIPSMKKYYSAAQNLIKQVQTLILDESIVLGNGATSDIFFVQPQQVCQYLDKLAEPIVVVDMECASFYQVADHFNHPMIALKIISDVLEKTKENSQQFHEFLPKAAMRLSLMLRNFLNIS
ncbi:5'-methylthioadenosine/S-adenosylhomocysteine nucleosidase [Mesoplasma whartonense]|uniref:5'-methylthioadenosine/S-adenosylhomocysteine nucleosidase n=1 Tax=Mesoplasma whartonense TaxID=2878854 RepID=UPI002022ACE5|nr:MULTISPECIES: 5'-methylthioadenosine/S-adenosylhomocysteine nucleosidase [unclassified Mesoplasma]MCL8212884.1 5'-methylthioadenosine/S-adenosylhomocysteine nucleosidase [Mesoplasma sp. JKS002661]MCL8216083.1 5'-methylthioadenosine/S-adenosylhomocysteine nucleosidase [Mesoplasma sp. JKS002657]